MVSACANLAEAGIDPATLDGPWPTPAAAHAAIAAACPSPDDRDRWLLARARLWLVAPGTSPGGSGVDADPGDADHVAQPARAPDIATRAAAQPTASTARSALRTRSRRGSPIVAAATARSRSATASSPAAFTPRHRRRRVAGVPRRDGHRPRHLSSALPAAIVRQAAALPAHPRADVGRTPHLRRLLAPSRRLNTEPDVARILDEVIDTAIEPSTAAERGFLLLRQDGSGELQPVAIALQLRRRRTSRRSPALRSPALRSPALRSPALPSPALPGPALPSPEAPQLQRSQSKALRSPGRRSPAGRECRGRSPSAPRRPASR